MVVDAGPGQGHWVAVTCCANARVVFSRFLNYVTWNRQAANTIFDQPTRVLLTYSVHSHLTQTSN